MAQTQPKFSKSELGATIIEEAFRLRYPDLWKLIAEKAATEREFIDIEKKRRKATISRGKQSRRKRRDAIDYSDDMVKREEGISPQPER